MSNLWRSDKGESVTGIILAGGKSSRMFTDKAVMTVQARPMMAELIDTLSSVVSEILIVTNHPDAYGGFDGRKFRDIIPDKGPLGGIYTGLTVSGTHRNVILACDMPFVNARFLRYMIEASSGFDAAVPDTRRGIEPLHAVYTKDCLEPILGRLRNGDLKVHSVFSEIHARYIGDQEIDHFDPEQRMFININDEHDLRRAQAIARAINES